MPPRHAEIYRAACLRCACAGHWPLASRAADRPASAQLHVAHCKWVRAPHALLLLNCWWPGAVGRGGGAYLVAWPTRRSTIDEVSRGSAPRWNRGSDRSLQLRIELQSRVELGQLDEPASLIRLLSKLKILPRLVLMLGLVTYELKNRL